MKKQLTLLIVAALILVISGCKKNNDGFGTLKLSITDDPFPVEYIDSAKVTISKVEIRNTDENDGYPFIAVFEGEKELNLLELRNGVMAELVEIEVPVGTYDLVRLYVDNASISVKDFSTFELKVPSGAQTGIKIFIDPGLRIEGGLTTELLLDFNLDKSFVLRGNTATPAGINGIIFKPVIRAVNNSYAGTVKGFVRDTASVVIPNAQVWIEKDTTIATAYSDSTGYYAIPGIPEGFYSLFSTKENYDTVKFENLEVVAANFTSKDFELTPKN